MSCRWVEVVDLGEGFGAVGGVVVFLGGKRGMAVVSVLGLG